ncbi:MAG TPA: DCC1-like thiol-disulfide oxidoreductase family protein [bacterium]|jgi:predicted DCC family thiol-disulfide oxidoreductase YuxK
MKIHSKESLAGKSVIIYDGFCVLCSRSMRFFKKIDKKKILNFIPRQSETGEEFHKRSGLDSGRLKTVAYIRNFGTEKEEVKLRSDAGLAILNDIGGIWQLVSWLRIVPKFIRDPVYNFIANNRARWFGRHDTCQVVDN